MSKTKIEWAEEVWNPVTGCTKVSPGCKNCYAERMSKRLVGRYGYPAKDPFKVTLHPDRLSEPLKWKKPRRIFVCSMGDLFHKAVDDGFIHDVMSTIASAPQHTFLVLTKRPERMRHYFTYFNGKGWPLNNLWLGVTIENQKALDQRAPELIQIPAARRFISYEPALGPLECLDGWLTQCDRKTKLIDLVICGGESGPGARPVHPDWVRGVRDQCKEAGVPFFFKQWGEWAEDKQHGLATTSVRGCRFPDGTLVERVGKKAAGRMLDGKECLEWPR